MFCSCHQLSSNLSSIFQWKAVAAILILHNWSSYLGSTDSLVTIHTRTTFQIQCLSTKQSRNLLFFCSEALFLCKEQGIKVQVLVQPLSRLTKLFLPAKPARGMGQRKVTFLPPIPLAGFASENIVVSLLARQY